jgi:phosphatidylinositol alpha-1,6-mannosyltransferase
VSKGPALLVTEVFPPQTGGSGRWFWELYRRMSPQDCVIVAGEHPHQEEFDRGHGLRLHRVPLSFTTWGIGNVRGLRQYGTAAGRLARLAREENVRILHCGKCLPEGLLGWILKRWHGLPYVCYVHGEELNLASRSRELTWLTRRVLHGAEFAIANSRNTFQLLRNAWGLPDERIHVLHPGVDTTKFVAAPRNVQWRAQQGWCDRRVVLTVGRLQKRKGHDVMVRALAPIARAVPDVLYAIVGDGEERASLGELVDRLGVNRHVQFLGEVNDEELLRCYQQCDLFVLPNRDVGGDIEGFGIVLLEAQSCGRPVVAGLSGGTGETMQAPSTGRLVRCDSADELAQVVSALLTDPAQLAAMGETARQWVVQRFDWSALTRQATELFGIEPRPSTGCADA